MKFSKIVILLSLFIVTPELTVANSPHNLVENTFFKDSLIQNTEIDVRTSYGFYAHHHFEMSSYSAHFPSFELSIQKQTYGKSSWQSYFNYPTIGVTALYSGLGNIDIIGKAYAIYPFINFPFNKSKTNTFGLRFGVGLGYITEKFDLTSNYHNISIGSNFNAAINIALEYKHYLSNRFKISVFAGLTHFSNGCSNYPNSGINIINAGAGLTYLLTDPHSYIPKSEYNDNYLKTIDCEYYIGISAGIKRIEYNQKENIGVYHIDFYIMDRISNLSKIGLGFDLVYDATDNISIIDDYGYQRFTFIEMLKPGISLAYELMIGDVSFLFNFGYHPYGLDMSFGRWYQKIAMKVDLGNYIYGKITLNTHFGVADFIGFGMGVKL
ncbi:MAG: acyloxyacyl hydrolase [Bacteroidales bacterium]|nr:acyloxyacyl hydrolase [Bacteroidales bacterium]